MILLSLDTSAEACSIALWRDGQIDSIFEIVPQQQSQLILPMIQTLLSRNHVTLEDCSAIAFGEGPGSFTGLRITAGVAQGLALAHQLPLIPISTLAALAFAAQKKFPEISLIVPVIDARMQEVYFGLYKNHSALIADSLSSPERAAAMLNEIIADHQWIGIGSGFKMYGESFMPLLSHPAQAILADALPDARDISMLAVQAYQQGQVVTSTHALPKYLRDDVAQVRK